MSRPEYVNWMVRYMRLRANIRSGSSKAVRPMSDHLRVLDRMTRENPMLGPAYLAVAEEMGLTNQSSTGGR